MEKKGEWLTQKIRMTGNENRIEAYAAVKLLHDTRNCCGLTREDYEDYIAGNPIRTTREIHRPCINAAELDASFDQWRKMSANIMTECFINNLKQSRKIDYPLAIKGSVEFDGKRYPIKDKLVCSKGRVVYGNKIKKHYYEEPSIYLALMTCISGKGILDFTMQFVAGKFVVNVYHERGMNVFYIYKLRPFFVQRQGDNLADYLNRDKVHNGFGTVTLGSILFSEIDFFD